MTLKQRTSGFFLFYSRC